MYKLLILNNIDQKVYEIGKAEDMHLPSMKNKFINELYENAGIDLTDQEFKEFCEELVLETYGFNNYLDSAKEISGVFASVIYQGDNQELKEKVGEINFGFGNDKVLVIVEASIAYERIWKAAMAHYPSFMQEWNPLEQISNYVSGDEIIEGERFNFTMDLTNRSEWEIKEGLVRFESTNECDTFFRCRPEDASQVIEAIDKEEYDIEAADDWQDDKEKHNIVFHNKDLAYVSAWEWHLQENDSEVEDDEERE